MMRWVLWAYLISMMTPVSAKEVAIEKLTAVYLYQLSRLTTWPESKHNQADYFNLCVLSDNPLSKVLETLKTKTIHGKKVSIKYTANIDTISHCHVLFLDNKVDNITYAEIAYLSYQHHILIINKQKHYIKNQWDSIQLFEEQQQLRFSVNYFAVKRASLQMSSRLLALAVEVIE